MSLTRQIHERLIATGAMTPKPDPSPPRAPRKASPPSAIVPPLDATALFRMRCIGACGDVLTAAAVAGALKFEHPGCFITFETRRESMLDGNPYIDAVTQRRLPLFKGERDIDLRPEADWHPKRHRLEFFAEKAGVSLDNLRFYVPRQQFVDDRLKDREYIVIHPGPTDDPRWVGRSWLARRWGEVAASLASYSTVVIVGKNRAVALGDPQGRVLDLRDRTSVHQLADIIGRAKLFVGIESLPGIIAQVLGVPAVLFFGSVLPELRIFRENVIPVRAAALACLGCHHQAAKPEITGFCRVGGEPCQSRLTVERVLSAIRSAGPLIRAPRATKVVLAKAAVRRAPPIKIANGGVSSVTHSPVVLLRRENSDGDVLVASSVAAAVKKRFPYSRLVFETHCPDLLRNHPHIDEVVAPEWQGHRDMLADMNVSCENLPYTNMLAVYASRAAVAPEECEFFLHTEPIHGLPDEYAVMHMGPPGAGKRRWVGRAWLEERFMAVADLLAERGLPTVLVGGSGNRGPWCVDRAPNSRTTDHGPRTTDLRGRTTLYQLAYVIAQAKLFVGIDSLPFHIAQAFNVPGVAFFGSIRPELRIYRENMKGVSATELSCIGCHHDRRTLPGEPPETSICRIGHEHCRSAVTVRRFIEAIDKLNSHVPMKHSPRKDRHAKAPECIQAPAHTIGFHHGLGDVAHFAASIPLYTRRGHRIRVSCDPRYRSLLQAAGAEVVSDQEHAIVSHKWLHADIPWHPHHWRRGNKQWHNLSAWPMPDIGRDDQLWAEYCQSQVDLSPHVTAVERRTIDRLLDEMPRPVVVCHTFGRQDYPQRSLPRDTVAELYRLFLGECAGSMVSCDVPGEAGGLESHRRLLPIVAELGRLPTTAELFWLLDRADLMIGIDSGPAHFARFAKNTPVIVCWTRPDPYHGCPSLLALPRPKTVHIVTNSDCRLTNPVPPEYNPRVSCGVDVIDARFVVDTALEILNGRNS